MLNLCPNCHGKTKNVKFEELPDKEQKKFHDDKEEVAWFEFCPNCNDYRAYLGGGFGGSFDDDDISFSNPTRKKLTTGQSLNSLCQCGSGKKYKRCCGAS